MFGYVTKEREFGAIDRILAEVAAQLRALGWPLAGAVQVNSGACTGGAHDMDLRLLHDDGTIRISQSLGRHSAGCRLDPAGLEDAVGRVALALAAAPAPRLLIVNKFGRQEAEGRGFRSVIAEAMGAGIPILTGVRQDHFAAFSEFSGDYATELPADREAVLDWCRRSAWVPPCSS